MEQALSAYVGETRTTWLAAFQCTCDAIAIATNMESDLIELQVISFSYILVFIEKPRKRKTEENIVFRSMRALHIMSSFPPLLVLASATTCLCGQK